MNISVVRMDDLCTACLCSGRNLYFIGETGFYHLFTDILNEIPVYDLSQVCVRVCWECRATLHRFQSFKETAKECYLELLQHLHQSTQPSNRPSHLQIEHINNISYPYIKTEDAPLDVDDRDESTDHMVHMDLDIKDEHEHSEETFVNDLKVEQDVVIKPKKEKKKKKMKIKKQIKVKKKPSPPESIPNSDVKDLEYDLDCHDNDAEPLELEETKESIELDMKKEEKNVIQEEEVTKEVTVTPKPKVPRSKEVLAEKPQCAECGKHFSSRKTYRYHLNVLHKGQNQYPCPRCGKVYQWKSNLGRHIRSHKARDAGELYCDMCDKRFASQATYRQHLKVSRRHVSESEFSFMCNDCGKKFVNKTRLRDHIDWEHLKKIKFRCQLCNKPFKCHTSLYVHMQNVHRNKEKKDNLCHVCGKSYQNAAKLKYHIVAMHTSETPYQCEQCSAAFGWYSSLYRHVREVHYKMKVQPKKSKRSKKQDAMFPHLALPSLHPPPP